MQDMEKYCKIKEDIRWKKIAKIRQVTKNQRE